MGDSGKHRLFVFSKLESFAKARDEVNKLLKECLRERPDVDVTDYHGSAVGVGKKYKTITAAVVIDKRQTRCLITPSRRDRNVDHWDELRTLYRQTIPHGSILLFIYGDDWSKDEDTMVSKKWFDIWRYNDTTAYELAFRSRCFTLDKKLNEKHRETLERYFSVVEKLAPGGEKNCKLKVSVAGNDERVSLTKYLETHPFLAIRSSDVTAKMKYKSVFPADVVDKNEKYRTKVRFLDFERPIQVCDSEKQEFDANVIRKLKSATKTKLHSPFKQPSRKRVVILCHCTDCCHLMYDDSKGYKKQLDKIYRKQLWQAFPAYDSITDRQDQEEGVQLLQEYTDEMIRFCTPGVVIEGEDKDKRKTGRSMPGCTSDKVASL